MSVMSSGQMQTIDWDVSTNIRLKAGED